MAGGLANLLESINSSVKPTKNHIHEFINWIEFENHHDSMKNFFIFSVLFSIFFLSTNLSKDVCVCELCSLFWDARNVYEYEKIGKIRLTTSIKCTPFTYSTYNIIISMKWIMYIYINYAFIELIRNTIQSVALLRYWERETWNFFKLWNSDTLWNGYCICVYFIYILIDRIKLAQVKNGILVALL